MNRALRISAFATILVFVAASIASAQMGLAVAWAARPASEAAGGMGGSSGFGSSGFGGSGMGGGGMGGMCGFGGSGFGSSGFGGGGMAGPAWAVRRRLVAAVEWAAQVLAVVAWAAEWAAAAWAVAKILLAATAATCRPSWARWVAPARNSSAR